MAAVRLRVDHRAIESVLRPAPAVEAIAQRAILIDEEGQNHQSVRRHKMPVKRESYKTDRAGEAVIIAHPGGLAVQAKYGALTRAARVAGLEVRKEADDK